MVALTPLVWRFLRSRYHKYRREGITIIPGPDNQSFLQGHFALLFSNDAWQFHRDLAHKYGRTSRVKGPLNEDMIYTYDPKAMHHVLVKDQDLYDETSAFIANNRVMFGPGLFSVKGETHRKQRKMLNPVFSVAHLRHMVPTFFEVSKQLSDTLAKKVDNGPTEIEVVTWMTRTALEIVGQSGLGTSFGPISEDHPEHEYITSVKEFGPLMTLTLFPRLLILPLVNKYNIGGAWLQRFIVNLVPSEPIRHMVKVIDTMYETSVQIFESKRTAMAQVDTAEAQRLGEAKDIIGILMRENAKAADNDRFTDAEVIAQMTVLMFAAMDTTSSALARILYLLSVHQDVQEKLRVELREARENFGEQPDHDQLVGLPYLDSVCRETLRVFPPVPTVIREAQKDAVLPLGTPIRDSNGKETSDIFLQKDTKILISIQASNTDPSIWGADAKEWRPERWIEPLPQSVSDARIPGIYSHLMTFIGGGRACIGFKFSQLEMKVILFTLINKFRFALPKQDIFWQMTIIASPTTDPALSQLRPDMPLAISLVEYDDKEV